MMQKLLSILIDTYSKPFDDVQLHRDMIGYVCIVSVGKERFVLKLFRNEHTKQALQSIEIMKYLYNASFETAQVISTSNGMPFFTFEFQGETRIGVLYEYINGVEPDKNSDIENIGRQTGKLHNLMQNYEAKLSYHAKPFYIDRYINILNEMNYPEVEKFKEYGDSLWKRVEMLPRGFSHGDYHTGNMILNTKGQYVLYDFDAAGLAFSIYDLAVICDMTDYFSLSDHEYADTSHMLERFLKGYREYRSISDEEARFIFDFIGIRHFEVQATIIENLGLSCVDKEFIDDQLAWLMKWDKLCKHRIECINKKELLYD